MYKRQGEERTRLLNRLIGSLGEGVWLEKPFRCNYGDNISIGENTFINCDCIFSDDNRITIGKNVMIAPRVQLYACLLYTSFMLDPLPDSADDLVFLFPFLFQFPT